MMLREIRPGVAAFRVGEVVEASTTQFVAESYELGESPPFGAFVRVALDARAGGNGIVGVISQVTTGSVDPGRRPVARGRDESTTDDVYRNNPEIRSLLRTQFFATVIGFVEGGEVRQFLPPLPAPLHAFVFACTDIDVRRFCEMIDFLDALANLGGPAPNDELVAACLRSAMRSGMNNDFLVQAGRRLALLCDNDVRRLRGILRRAQS
jgi:hypothetical protein